MAVVLDLSSTAHCRSHTGIQRVCRQLYVGLAQIEAAPTALVFDPYANRWRLPDVAERQLLTPAAAESPGYRRSEVWRLGQKLRGYMRLGAEPDWVALRNAPLICAEVFNAKVFAAYAGLRTRLGGKTVAVFHDAVALRHPEFSLPDTIARTKAYLRELAQFDGIAANSETSRRELMEHWSRLGLRNVPPVLALPLAVDAPKSPTALPANFGVSNPMVLCVGTIEGRKNHLALLEAAEILWKEGARFNLIFAGLPRPATAATALNLAAKLQAAGRPLELTGPVPESRLEELYAKCQFTVYPSIYEGFGLPVAESLHRGRPCICGPGGALEEIAQGGGCMVVPEPTTPHLVEALRQMLGDERLRARLSAEATQRRFPTWAEYSHVLLDWVETLHPHKSL